VRGALGVGREAGVARQRREAWGVGRGAWGVGRGRWAWGVRCVGRWAWGVRGGVPEPGEGETTFGLYVGKVTLIVRNPLLVVGSLDG